MTKSTALLRAPLLRLARECCSALLMALLLVSTVAQARVMAGHDAWAGGPARFTTCEAMADGESAPAPVKSHGCMACCPAVSPVVPMQGAEDPVLERRLISGLVARKSLRVEPFFLVQEARGPP